MMMRTRVRGRIIAASVSAALVTAVLVPIVPAFATATPPPPLLVGSEVLPSGAGAAGSMNLTALGQQGWVHADADGIESNAGADSHIVVENLHPATPVATLTDSPVAFSWSNGTKTATASGVTTGAVYRYDLSTVGDTTTYAAGYRVTVPADDTVRQFVMVAGIWQADSDFTVTTLDGGTPTYATQLTAGGAASVRKTTVTLRPGQGAIISSTLRKTLATDGNVSFMGAYLRSMESGVQLATAPAPSTLDLTATGSLDWLHFDGATLDRSSDGNGALAAENRDSAGTINRQGDNPTSFSWTNGTSTVTQSGTRTGGVFLARNDDFSQPWGWDVTVAAAAEPRTLRFVAGSWQASATLTVTLDGAAAAAAIDNKLTAGGAAVSYLYTISIPAGSAATISAQLTNTTDAGGNGNITLAGVALSEQDFRSSLADLLEQVNGTDVAGADSAMQEQLAAETDAAKAASEDASASALVLQREFYLLQAALSAATASASGALYSYQSSPGLTSSFGWEGDKDAPIAFIDGSYRLRDHDNAMITFGVPNIPGKIKWYNAEGYLPSFVSEYSKAGLDIRVQSFSDEAVVDGNRYEIAYSRMTVKNTTSTAAKLPKVSGHLIALDSGDDTTVAAGATVRRDYAVGADRFGNTYAWPSDEKITALGSFDDHYAHMRTYWNDRLSKVANITALPNESLINAYKAGYIYTLIIRDDVDGQKQLHVGENGYDEMFDHDTIGIVSNLLTMGDFRYAKEYLATLPAQLQYQDAKWKYSVPYAIYLERTGDDRFVRDHFDVIKTNTHTIETDREDNGTGIIKITNAIDSDGHWTVDNWSALYGLSTYKYLAQKLGESAEAQWAQSEYDSLMAAANAKLDATQSRFGLNYIPMAMDEPNETGPRSEPRDANWASMFLFGGWAWDSYLYGMPQSGSMLDQIDQTYSYGIQRRAGVSDSPYNFGGYPHGYYSSAYNAGYGGAALRGEEYRDIGIKAYEFMIAHSQSGPFGWWEGVDYPNANSPWDIDHAAGGGGSDQHMWGQAMGTNVLFNSLVSLKSDGSLIVGRGVPADWVVNGKKVALNDFPVSNGGRIGYSMKSNKNTVHIVFSGDLGKVPSVSIELLALKDNIASVNVKRALVDAKAGTVTLPGGTKSVTIRMKHATNQAGKNAKG